jgi:Carboxypeptidase regulatory-like domain
MRLGALSRAVLIVGLAACWSQRPAQTTPIRVTPVEVVAEPTSSETATTGGVTGIINERATGIPLHNAVVELRDASGKVGHVNTDADGRYRFDGVVAGDYQLVIGYSTVDGSGSAQRAVTVRDTTETIDVKLQVQPR